MSGSTSIEGILPILDLGPLVAPERALDVARALLAGGAKALQLRAKALPARDFLSLARELRALTLRQSALLFVNDRPDIAVLSRADGVHLGQQDLPARDVRSWIPPTMSIGVSCHSVADLEAAVAAGGASYFGFGPVYETTSKQNPDPVVGLDGLARARARLPDAHLVGIGGITIERVPAVRRAGARAAAMISGLLATSDVEARMRAALAAWERT